MQNVFGGSPACSSLQVTYLEAETMAQDAYYQYQSFNWDANADWSEYKSKLEIPSDNPNILTLKQQKWFKNNIVRITCLHLCLINVNSF